MNLGSRRRVVYLLADLEASFRAETQWLKRRIQHGLSTMDGCEIPEITPRNELPWE